MLQIFKIAFAEEAQYGNQIHDILSPQLVLQLSLVIRVARKLNSIANRTGFKQEQSFEIRNFEINVVKLKARVLPNNIRFELLMVFVVGKPPIIEPIGLTPLFVAIMSTIVATCFGSMVSVSISDEPLRNIFNEVSFS